MSKETTTISNSDPIAKLSEETSFIAGEKKKVKGAIETV